MAVRDGTRATLSPRGRPLKWIPGQTCGEAWWAPRSTQIVMAGLLLTAVLVFAQTASQAIDFHFFHLRLRVLDSDHHGSIFGVTSLLAQVVAAAAIGLRAVSLRRLSGLLVAAIVGVLIVPRALMKYVPAFGHYDVPILLVPMTAVLVALCALTLRDARLVRIIVWGALGLLAFSFALHAVGLQADNGARTYVADYTWAYQITGMLKHSAELAGWLLVATGMGAALSAAAEGAIAGNHMVASRYSPTAS